jgi:hypothetical protein
MPRDETLQDLDDLFAASAAVRRRFEWQVYLNIAFYVGNQWVAWDGNQLYEPQVEEWREKVVDNRIQPFVRTEIAKMTKTRPQWVGVPRTQSDQDVSAARYAELALEDAWKRHDMLRKLRAALLWSRVAGAGFWKVWWDPTLGDKRDVLVYGDTHPDENLRGASVKDSYGRPVKPDVIDQLPVDMAQHVDKCSVAMGDLCVDLRTFFEVYPDPLAGEEGLESAEFIGEESVYSRDFVERHFPDYVDKLTYDADPSAGIAESRLPMLAAPSTSGKARGCKIREYWSRDKHCIWSGKTLLKEESNPFPWLPYVMFRGTPVPGRFWPDCPVTHLRPRQADLNKRLSQLAENAERIGNPPLLVPSSMGEEWVWNGLPGEEVVYPDNGSPNAAPRFMDIPSMPAYIENDVQRAIDSILEIGGQHEVSGAQVPAGVTAAAAINLLQEADDTRLGPDVADMEDALSHVGRRALWIIRRLYSDKRHLMVAGEDGQWDVVAFKGDMTDGCEDIEVQAGSGMPQSKAAQQAMIQQLLTLFIQNGVQLSERSLRKIVGELNVGGLGQFFASQSRDEGQIQEENRRLSLMTSGGLEINSYDNDGAHVEGHQDFMKTSRYDRLPRETKAIFEQHVADHRDRQATMTGPPQLTLPIGGAGAAAPPQNGSAPTMPQPSLPS